MKIFVQSLPSDSRSIEVPFTLAYSPPAFHTHNLAIYNNPRKLTKITPMVPLPKDLNEAVTQAQAAAQAALDAGYLRIQVEINIPELKIQPIAEQFIQPFTSLESQLRLLFPDAGAAALARRDWNNPAFTVRGLNETKIKDEESLFIFIEPSSVEVEEVEKICDAASPRPIILLNPCLEDVVAVGIGYAARRLRDRFLSTIEPCYYLQPLDQAALFRCYPGSWELWQEQDGTYRKIQDFATKPSGEDVELILYGDGAEMGPADQETGGGAAPGSGNRPGVLTRLQRFIKALSQ